MPPTIRHAEPDDYDAIALVYAQPLAAAGTMQIPLQSREVWKKRLAAMGPLDCMLVAVVNGEVVGNLGIHPAPQPRRFLLATADAHGLYAQFGFEPLAKPERMMQILAQ